MSERMTIYDVLRYLIVSVKWAATDVENAVRANTAVALVNQLEEVGLLGQLALEVKTEEV